MDYSSIREISATSCQGVRFRIARMSYGRRLELTRHLREIGSRLEFEQAGQTVSEKLEAALLTAEINRIYVAWGLIDVSGLTVDGQDATPELLLAQGPEDLVQEIIAAIRRECGLSETERKNL